MTLAAECPRCSLGVSAVGDRWRCEDHGLVTPLWRATTPCYEAFADHLGRAEPLPTWLPWPLAPGWQVNDFGCVAQPGDEARAGFAACSGPSELDGVVEVVVVSEEPGVGLGARCARASHTDPGPQIQGPPHARVRVDGHPVPLWSVSTATDDPDFDRSVMVGEAHGRWLWLVLRPASVALMLQDRWNLRDVSGLGPELVTLPFGEVPRVW